MRFVPQHLGDDVFLTAAVARSGDFAASIEAWLPSGGLVGSNISCVFNILWGAADTI